MKLRGWTKGSLLQELPAWGVSLLVNLLVLLSLNFIVREVRSEPEQVAISSIMEQLQEPQYQFSATITDQVGAGGSVGGAGGGRGRCR